MSPAPARSAVLALACLLGAAASAPVMIGSGPLVVHWNLAGRPDGTLPGTLAWAVTSGVGSAGAVLVLMTRARRRRFPLTTIGLFVASLFTGLGLLVALANAGEDGLRLPLALVLPVILLASGALIVGKPRRKPVTGHERARWQGRCKSRFAVPTGMAFMAAAAVLGALVHPAWAILAAGGLCVLALVEIRVRVTSTTLTIAYSGALRWPRTAIALQDVLAVEVIEVDPKRYGGWGYRGSLRLLRRAAVNLRRGPGLRLTFTDGARFVFTVEDAPGAADAIRRATDSLR